MKKPIRENRSRGVCASLAAATATIFGAHGGAAMAGPLNFAPYVQVGVEQDSNLFRVNEDADGETRDEDSDTITHGTLGADATWEISRQQLLFEGFVRENRYDDFDELDNTSHDAYAAWLYQIGPILSGTLDIRRTKELNNFEDLDAQEKDFRETTNPRLETFLAVSPRFRLRAEVGYLDFEHSLESQQRFNREEQLTGLELQFLGKPGSSVGIGAEYIDGEYPNRRPGDIVPPEFEELFGFVTANWGFSGISRFRGRVGYTQRESSGTENDRDFDGVTGALGYQRDISGKTRFDAELFRNIFSVDDVDALFVESTGARLKLTWEYSEKLSLAGALAYVEDEYESPPGTTAENRDDEREAVEAELIYSPIRPLSFIFSVAAEDRESSDDSESYEYIRGGLAVRFTFDTEPEK